MSLRSLHFVICAGIVPDPLQTLEPSGLGLKNEMLLPHVLDPFCAHAFYEASHMCTKYPESKIWIVSLAPKMKLQQVMMNVAQKGKFELIAIDGPSTGFSDPYEVATYLAEAINNINGLDKNKMMIFGGWESASRGYGITLQLVGELLGIQEQFYGVDRLEFKDDGSIEILERIEGGKHQLSLSSALPIVVGWATGTLPEPPNNPQIGMMNMRTIMPSLQKAKSVKINNENLKFLDLSVPSQLRETKIIKDMSVEDIAHDIIKWINA